MWWWQTSWVEYWTLTMISLGSILLLGGVIVLIAWLRSPTCSGSEDGNE